MNAVAIIFICFLSCVWRGGSAQNVSDKMMFGRELHNLSDFCDQTIDVSVYQCYPYHASSDASLAFYFPVYPIENCTVNIKVQPCLGKDGVFGNYTTYFHVRSMTLQHDDEFHIIRSKKNFTDDQRILSFTRAKTVCKTKPQSSCGHVLGTYGSDWTYYKMVFLTSPGNKTRWKNTILIDTEAVRQLNSSRKVSDSTEEVSETYVCPALNGRLHRIQMCESGDRVHCPSSYEASASPDEPKAVTTRMQAYSWPLYPKYCITNEFFLTTTLAPAPTAIAPLSSDDGDTYLANYTTIYMDNPCNLRHILPCSKDDVRRAGTLRFLYGKLPRNKPNDKVFLTNCKIELEVDGGPCNGGQYSIFTHIKRVKLTPAKANRLDGDNLRMLDAADETTNVFFIGSRARPRYSVVGREASSCTSGKYTTCGTYSTAFSTDPRMNIDYDPGPDDGVLGFADRVIVDYVVIAASADESAESKCDELKGYMPTRLMCETRDRINCPAVGSYDRGEMKPVDNVQQGPDWSDYNDKCVELGFPKSERPTTQKRTTATTEETTKWDRDTWLQGPSGKPKPTRSPGLDSDLNSDLDSDLESNTRRRRRSGAGEKRIPPLRSLLYGYCPFSGYSDFTEKVILRRELVGPQHWVVFNVVIMESTTVKF